MTGWVVPVAHYSAFEIAWHVWDSAVCGVVPVVATVPVAPVAYQVILEPGIDQFREFEPRRVHIRIISLRLFLVHRLTCGKRESVS